MVTIGKRWTYSAKYARLGRRGRVALQLDHFRRMFLFELFSRCIPLLPMADGVRGLPHS